MSKKDNLMKGFNNLIQSTENIAESKIKEIGEDSQPSKRLDDQTAKSVDVHKYKRPNVAKYKELRKCTLYLPAELIDSLAIMKVKTKRDLSELTAEALREYLITNKFLNI